MTVNLYFLSSARGNLRSAKYQKNYLIHKVELLTLFFIHNPPAEHFFSISSLRNTQKEFFELHYFFSFFKFHVMLNPQFHLYLFMYIEPITSNHRAYLRWTNWINGPAPWVCQYSRNMLYIWITVANFFYFFNASIKMSLSVNFNTILWVFSHAALMRHKKTIICNTESNASWGAMGSVWWRNEAEKKGKN